MTMTCQEMADPEVVISTRVGIHAQQHCAFSNTLALAPSSPQPATTATAEEALAPLSCGIICGQIDTGDVCSSNTMEAADAARGRSPERDCLGTDARSNSREDALVKGADDAMTDGSDDDCDPYVPRRRHWLPRQSHCSAADRCASGDAPGANQSVSSPSPSCRGDPAVALVWDRPETRQHVPNTLRIPMEGGSPRKGREGCESACATDDFPVRAHQSHGCQDGGENSQPSSTSFAKSPRGSRKRLKIRHLGSSCVPSRASTAICTPKPSGRSCPSRPQRCKTPAVRRPPRPRTPSAPREVAMPSPTWQTDNAPMWAVDRIVKRVCRKGKLFYKVKWEDTWEPAESLRGCADFAIADYLAESQ